LGDNNQWISHHYLPVHVIKTVIIQLTCGELRQQYLHTYKFVKDLLQNNPGRHHKTMPNPKPNPICNSKLSSFSSLMNILAQRSHVHDSDPGAMRMHDSEHYTTLWLKKTN